MPNQPMTADDVLRRYIEKSGSKQPKITSVADGMASIDGRWIPFGTRLPSGWVVNGSNGQKAQLSYGGVPFEQDMGHGTVFPMEETPDDGYAPVNDPTLNMPVDQNGDTSADEDEEFIPIENKDGSWSMPHFGDATFGSMEELLKFKKNYAVKDRTGIDEFLKGYKGKKEKQAMGTLSDYFKLKPEERAKGMKIFNNETQDFTDVFTHNLKPAPEDVAPPDWDNGGLIK